MRENNLKKKLNKSEQFYYNAYKKDKHPFSNWHANNIKNGVRIVDYNDCSLAWNKAIEYAIRIVNKSNYFDIINNLRKLKVTDE